MIEAVVDRPDLADPATYDHGIPHAAFRDLRTTPGLVWNPSGPWGSGFWSVTRLDDLVAVSRDPMTYSSELGHIQLYDVDEDVRAVRASMIDLDPPVHTRLRRLISSAFTPRHVQGYVEDIRGRVRSRLDSFVEAGGGDWVSAVAAPIAANATPSASASQRPWTAWWAALSWWPAPISLATAAVDP